MRNRTPSKIICDIWDNASLKYIYSSFKTFVFNRSVWRCSRLVSCQYPVFIPVKFSFIWSIVYYCLYDRKLFVCLWEGWGELPVITPVPIHLLGLFGFLYLLSPSLYADSAGTQYFIFRSHIALPSCPCNKFSVFSLLSLCLSYLAFFVTYFSCLL